jgi:hypothetical protein
MDAAQLLSDLDGTPPLSCDNLSTSLGWTVVRFEVVSGSERRWPQSKPSVNFGCD